jgi:hypothetical protein
MSVTPIKLKYYQLCQVNKTIKNKINNKFISKLKLKVFIKTYFF